MKLCIDLCSGLEGLCSAFKNAGGWEVLTVDIEAKFSPDILSDVRAFDYRAGDGEHDREYQY